MSTVKIKTEPTTTATAAAVDVKVKLEQYTSDIDTKVESDSDKADIDTKVESDSEADNEKDDIKSENDDDEDTDQSQTTVARKKQRKFSCEYPGCGRCFNHTTNLRMHEYEHRLKADINIYKKTYILIRQTLCDGWPCPLPECTSILKTAKSASDHIRVYHPEILKQQQLREQQPLSNITRRINHFVDMVNFYMNEVRCGYHNPTGVFICYECRLVPECLLTHLQQKHGYDEKSIDSSVLPDSAVTASADPNINQHTSNPYLAAAIREPHWQHHQNIVQGWLCVRSDCGYCGYTSSNMANHKRNIHQGEEFPTVPALLLCLTYAKPSSFYFLIARIDQASGAVTASSNRIYRHKLDYNHNRLNAQDENGDNADQNETTEDSSQKRQWKCERSNCGRLFNSTGQLSSHRHEHKLETVISVKGRAYNLTRQSSDDRWTCPVPECETTYKTVEGTHKHILKTHSTLLNKKRANGEDGEDQQQQITKRTKPAFYYLNVDDFYVSGTRCGYHNPTGVFICYKCRLGPECLLTHLQQKHRYDGKSIENSVLPESASITGSDPNGNQHTNNSHLAAAISQPYQQQHQDIIQGWLCVISDCGYCGYTISGKSDHKKKMHKGEQLFTAPALVLRLLYGKAQTSCFLITRLDAVTNNVNSNKSASQYISEYDYDDGDELVLSDYSDDDNN